MMTTLRIALLLKIHNHIVRFDNHVNRSWQTPDPVLIRAAETKDSDIDRGDIADMEANSSDELDLSFFNGSFTDYEAVEEEEPGSKNQRKTKRQTKTL